MDPAIALLELSSIAIGIRAGDAMVKRAPVEVTFAGTVHPGKYLVLVGGDVASVEEAYGAGLDAGHDALIDRILLPAVHPELAACLRGKPGTMIGEALGVVETRTAAATIGAADRGLKGADVSLAEIRLADQLGGKAYCVFAGSVSDVEAAVEIAVAGLPGPDSLIAQVVIPQFHDEMRANLVGSPEFARRIAGGGE